MSVTIVATVGGSTSNSFVTETEAIAYMATRLNASAWSSVSGTTCTEDEKKAMIEATRTLSVKGWIGTRVTDTQALSWPRQWAPDPDAPLPSGDWYYDVSEIPQRVKDATCELAFQFLNLGDADLAALDPMLSVRVKTVDVLTTEYVEPYQRAQGLNRFPRVMDFIRPLLCSTGSTTPIIRG